MNYFSYTRKNSPILIWFVLIVIVNDLIVIAADVDTIRTWLSFALVVPFIYASVTSYLKAHPELTDTDFIDCDYCDGEKPTTTSDFNIECGDCLRRVLSGELHEFSN